MTILQIFVFDKTYHLVLTDAGVKGYFLVHPKSAH